MPRRPTPNSVTCHSIPPSALHQAFWVVEVARCAARGAGDKAAYLLARTVAAGHTAAPKVAANHREALALFCSRHLQPLEREGNTFCRFTAPSSVV